MATSTAGGYGAYSPQEGRPFDIESVLAKIVGENNPAEAANMLDTYQVQRQTAQGNYDYAMAGQHEFAKEQLRQQLYEAKMKAFPDIAKLPGGARFVAQGGMPGLYEGDPNALAGLASAGDVAQNAVNLEHGGTGLLHATQAGFQPSSDQATAATGGLAGPQGTPLQLQIERENNATRLQTASIHAANAKGPKVNVPYKFMTENGEEITVQVPIPLGATSEQREQLVQGAAAAAGAVYKPGVGVPGMAGPGTSGVPPPQQTSRAAPAPGTATAPTPPPPSINLQPKPGGAQAATPQQPAAPGGGGGGAFVSSAKPASTQVLRDPTTQAHAARGLALLNNPEAAKDIHANTAGAVLPVFQLSNGKKGYMGASGRMWELP